MTQSPHLCKTVVLIVTLVALNSTAVAESRFELGQGDRIAYIGNTLADRMQHSAWLETYIHALFPEYDLTFRNLGFSGDEVKTRMRSSNFGSPDQWLTKVRADVVFCFFGYNEALRGEAELPSFRKDFSQMIDGMLGQSYNGKSAPRLVIFSPIAHEDLKSRHLPDGSENNRKLELYTTAMQEICRQKNVRFVDLFAPTKRLYAIAQKPLTMNGIHLLDDGNRLLANIIVKELFGTSKIEKDEPELLRLRDAVLDKNYHWFSRYRSVDGYNVYGGRSKLAWFGQSNADVMMREMEIFDIMTANRDQRVWAVARGGDIAVKDDNLPPELEVKPNRTGPLEGGRFPYIGAQAAIEKMTVHEGMDINLFASEEMFPRLVNPVQMAVDTDSRLWVSVWASYPHWNPIEPRKDALVILPDKDGDGIADDCIVFADELNSVTAFEFWGGGVLVAAPPEIWFLKDTDGDDKADFKLRMLQGISSADTHHSANSMVIGPDGWLYWSRGIFNVANFETPTRSCHFSKCGVYRFNPRTFEVEFHYPIGPNPHGDAFDQWGFQFASDGTSATGNYVNIGKGIGSRQWYKKRVRPLPAIGFLSSSQFPEKYRGNFLICNVIGFLGVLQLEVKYNGAEITAEEIEPIVVSSDPNFRPTDLEIGGDGGLYIADWHNALIGHMQHNMRDPNRDHSHGRIYRVTYPGRPLLKPALMRGSPIEQVCENFLAKENGTRYRARLELTGRDSDAVVSKVTAWAAKRDVSKPDDAQALLECLWVFEEQRVPNGELLKTVFQAEEPRIRAAAIRTLGHWGTQISDWETILIAAARDESALVRAEAAKAAVAFDGLSAAEAIFEVATRPTDPELDIVLKYAKQQINVDKLVQDAVNSGRPLSQAARAYALQYARVQDLLKLGRTESVYEAILSRTNVPVEPLRESLDGLAKLRHTAPLDLLIEQIQVRDRNDQTESLSGLGQLLAEQSPSELTKVRDDIEKLAVDGKASETRRLAYVAWITADGSGDNAFVAASASKERLRDLLAAVPSVGSDELRGQLYEAVRSLMFQLPLNLEPEPISGLHQNGIQVDYFYPSASDVAIETLARMQPQDSGIVPEIVMNVPQKKQNDRFALRFTGMLQVPRSGQYTFYTKSDDGSRFYIGPELVVNNDGKHGMSERSGSINLSAGPHAIVVTYFDNGGGDGLIVSWSGPGIKKQTIPADRLAVSGGETLHDLAIRSLASIPGHEKEKFLDLASLVKAGKHRAAAISVLCAVSEPHWSQKDIGELVDNLIGYLSEIPAQYRTSGPAMDAIALTRALSKRLPEDRTKSVEEHLQNLDVRIIAIGTVPTRMIYDKERLAVQAGKPVEFRLSNSDNMPHNFTIVLPGALEEVGLLAEATANEPDAVDRQYVPVSDKILVSSRLLEPGQKQALPFDVPTTPGVYPYVCTYPGHWRLMHGALYVVEDLHDYLADPDGYLAAHPLPLRDELLKYIGRNTEWKFTDLVGSAVPLAPGRSFDVGKSLFTVANCVACHKVDDAGREIGPDLTKLDEKKHSTEYILRSILEPSKDIAEQYQSNVFILTSGKVLTGMVVEETASQVKVLVDPLAKADPVVVQKSEIDERVKSPLSIMPQGLLNKLSEEEILDLIAYIYARGDKKHDLFATQPSR